LTPYFYCLSIIIAAFVSLICDTLQIYILG
jgi:hypothetical protein